MCCCCCWLGHVLGSVAFQEYVSGNLVDCQFSGNNAGAAGGGIAQVSLLQYCILKLIVTDCSAQFSASAADSDAGIAAGCTCSSTVLMQPCQSAQASAFVELADCSFFGNSAQQHGGGVFALNSVGSVTGSQFAGNSAGGYRHQRVHAAHTTRGSCGCLHHHAAMHRHHIM